MNKTLLLVVLSIITATEANQFIPTYEAPVINSTNSNLYIYLSETGESKALSPNMQQNLSFSFAHPLEMRYFRCLKVNANRIHCGNNGYPPKAVIEANEQSDCTAINTGTYSVEIKCIRLD